MTLIVLSILIVLVVVLLVILLMFYFHQTRNYDYWKRKGVPYKNPSFPFGSTSDLVLARTYIGKGYDKMYKEFPNDRFFGIIEVQNPALVIRDPDLVKLILVKDFNHFEVRTNLATNPKEYILKHVINMNGQEWKDMRALLSPAFTSGKMKTIFCLMENCSERLKEQIFMKTKDNSTLEITDILARFTMDIIASCAFGLDTDCISNANCEFFDTVGAMLRTSKTRFFKRILMNFFPSLVKLFTVKLISEDVTRLLTKAVRDSVTYREQNGVKRYDFLDTLIQTRREVLCSAKSDTNKTKNGLTIEQMTAQAFVFFIAGYTTDTCIMAFCLYELSRHLTIQERLYQDIQEAVKHHGGKLTYQSLQEMTYMDQVVNETLRLYGSGQILIRTCTQPYSIPDTDIVLEKGVRVIVPTYSLHHDPQYWADPYQFNPDRFTPEKLKGRHPFVFLPFGEGPRNCIGRSFGLLQIKIGLATIISNFLVELSPGQEVPLEIDRMNIVVTPANPVHLKFTERKKLV